MFPYNSTGVVGDFLELYWSYDAEQNYLKMAFRYQTDQNYVGLALNTSVMVPSRAIVALSGNSTPIEYDMKGRDTLAVVPIQDISPPLQAIYRNTRAAKTITSGTVSNLTCYFEVNLQENPVPDVERLPLIYAAGPRMDGNAALGNHGVGARGDTTVNLTSAEATLTSGSGVEAIVIAHGVLMFLSWNVMVPFSILAARWMRHLDPTWFKTHYYSNWSAVIIFVIAFILGIITGSRTQLVHLGLGIAVLVLTAIQISVAQYRPGKDTPSRMLWYVTHFGAGKVLWVLATANVFIGLNIVDAHKLFYAGVGILAAIFVLLASYGQFRRVMNSQTQPQTPQKDDDVANELA